MTQTQYLTAEEIAAELGISRSAAQADGTRLYVRRARTLLELVDDALALGTA